MMTTIERRSIMHQTLLALPAAPALVRRALAGWLHDRGVAAEQRDDLILAVNEAVTNVVDHAYRDREAGFVELDLQLGLGPDGHRWVTLAVTDYGQWREPGPNKGFRGRGIMMIRACTDWCLLERHGVGTRVTMSRRVS